jgi:hypothetical protein
MPTEIARCIRCGKQALYFYYKYGYWVRCDCNIGPLRTVKREAVRAWNKRRVEE